MDDAEPPTICFMISRGDLWDTITTVGYDPDDDGREVAEWAIAVLEEGGHTVCWRATWYEPPVADDPGYDFDGREACELIGFTSDELSVIGDAFAE